MGLDSQNYPLYSKHEEKWGYVGYGFPDSAYHDEAKILPESKICLTYDRWNWNQFFLIVKIYLGKENKSCILTSLTYPVSDIILYPRYSYLVRVLFQIRRIESRIYIEKMF